MTRRGRGRGRSRGRGRGRSRSRGKSRTRGQASPETADGTKNDNENDEVTTTPITTEEQRSVFNLVSSAIGDVQPLSQGGEAPRISPAASVRYRQGEGKKQGTESGSGKGNGNVGSSGKKKRGADATGVAGTGGRSSEGIVANGRMTNGKGTSNVAESYNRKDKSLALLCQRFVKVYGMTTGEEVSIDGAATALNVEKRRIYDIVNVLEAIGVIVKEGKNRCRWVGIGQMKETFESLKKTDLKKKFSCPGMETSPALPPSSLVTTAMSGREESVIVGMQKPSPASSQDTTAEDPDAGASSQERRQWKQIASAAVLRRPTGRTTSRKEKSLAALSQRFVQLFLLAPKTLLSLEQAARRMLTVAEKDPDPLIRSPADHEAGEMKTKVRRLYDIANILTSLNLVEKVHTSDRKPVFRWLGIEGVKNRALGKRASESNDIADIGSGAKASVKRRRAPPQGSGTSPREDSMTQKMGNAQAVPIVPSQMPHPGHNQQHQEQDEQKLQQQQPHPDQPTQLWWMQQLLQQMFQQSTEGMSAAPTLSTLGGAALPFQNSPSLTMALQWKAWMEQDQKRTMVQEQQGQQKESQSNSREKQLWKGPADEPALSATTWAMADSQNVPSAKEMQSTESECDNPAQQASVAQGQRLQPPASTKASFIDPGFQLYSWMSPEYVSTYMEQAEKAGPQYAAQARQWLESLKQWQSTWGAWVTGVSSKFNESLVTGSATMPAAVGQQ